MIQTLSAQTGTCIELKKGQCLKVIDIFGDQVSDLFCVDASNLENYFSAQRTLDYNDGIYLKKGSKLYSNSSDELMTVIEDTCGRHDLLMPPCSLKMFQHVAGNEDYHPSCHENLATHLKAKNIPESSVNSTLNIFMNVSLESDGRYKIDAPLSKPGDYVVLKAEKDLYVGLTACSHEESNNSVCKPIAFEIL